jgi:uncharacterized protein
MKTVLILHGIGGHAGKHWMQWLHDELVHLRYKVIIPSLPDPDHPDRETWLELAKKLTKNVDFKHLTLIGHSLGVATALDLIEAKNKKVERLISVAGFAVDYGADLNGYFMREQNINLAKVRKLVGKINVIYGDDDPYVTQEALCGLAKELGVKPHIINNGGHINKESGFIKFPLIIDLMDEK